MCESQQQRESTQDYRNLICYEVLCVYRNLMRYNTIDCARITSDFTKHVEAKMFIDLPVTRTI
jgi:hypothetical protein